MNIFKYLRLVEKRIYTDEWRVGWFKVAKNIPIGKFNCNLIIYGHSRYFRQVKPFFISKIMVPRIFPYSAVAMVFIVDYIDVSIIEELISSVKEFMRTEEITTPEKVKWGVDVAYVAIVSSKLGRGIEDYVKEVYNSEVVDQYMKIEGSRGLICKKIGLVVIDVAKEEIYYGKDMFSKEAYRLFNPKLSLVEKIADAYHKLWKRKNSY